MNKQRNFLIVLSIFSIIGLLGMMMVINATVAGIYDDWGQGMNYKSVLVPVATLVPVPLIVALCALAVFAKKAKTDWVLHFLEIIFWVQAGFVLAVPVLLATLENELNGPTIIVPSFGICICCTFALVLRILRKQL